MAIPVYTPRINNNDDEVRFSHIVAEVGSAVRKGDPVAEIETDKATFTVEAEQDGYVLGFTQNVGDTVPVGSVLLWMGSVPGETIPSNGAKPAPAAQIAEPTLKAALLLAKFGLNAAAVPSSGERLSAADVLGYVRAHNVRSADAARGAVAEEPVPELPPGKRVPLNVTERGMIRTVAWHRDSAVSGYVEIGYSPEAWQQYADAFQSRYKTLMSPLLPLMAHRLVRMAAANPRLNSTIAEDQRYTYDAINLGFTAQSGNSLFMLSIRDAGTMDEKAFHDAWLSLMKQAMKGKVPPQATGGVTIAFTSMSRWEVTRHIPVLPPYTSLIIAHAHGSPMQASLGASYDHRVLTGGEVAVALRKLSCPSEGD
jgi:pyruvate/2-oxoglutarate dehydrogenase complex dihydrolipoamide acyltransferase (E2) component